MIPACVLALVLSMDVSASVRSPQFRLQTDGVAQALGSPEVVEAVLSSLPMAIVVQQWSDQVDTAVPWTMIRSREDLQGFADRVAAMGRHSLGSTGLERGLAAALSAMAEAPCDAERRVVDVSGDGRDDYDIGVWANGDDPSIFYGETRTGLPKLIEKAASDGITINGLPIYNEIADDNKSLVDYYFKFVRTPDGRIFPADTFDDFARAMARKLRAEIASRGETGYGPAHALADAPPPEGAPDPPQPGPSSVRRGGSWAQHPPGPAPVPLAAYERRRASPRTHRTASVELLPEGR